MCQLDHAIREQCKKPPFLNKQAKHQWKIQFHSSVFISFTIWYIIVRVQKDALTNANNP